MIIYIHIYIYKWFDTILSGSTKWKKHYKYIAIIDDDVEKIKKITNCLDAHKVDSVNDDPLILKIMNKMNWIVHKDEYGVVQQGVFIGTPIMAGWTII